MPYGSSLGTSLPTVSVTAGPTYATQVNAFLTAIQTTVEAKVTPGGFDMTSDLSFLSGATYRRVKDLLGASFQNQTSALNATTYPRTAYFTGSDNDFWVNDGAGRQIQLTTGGAVNVSTTGGITGSGYGSGGVAINWNSGLQAYQLKAGSGVDAFASSICKNLQINDASGNYLTIASPALASDYTITLPAAVPVTSNTVLAMSSAGVVTASATPTVTTITTTGAATIGAAATVGSTLGVTGKITASGDISLPTRFLHISSMMIADEGNGIGPTGTGNNPHFDAPGTVSYFVPLPLLEGDLLISITILGTTSATAGTRTLAIGYWNTTVGTWQYAGGAATVTWAASSGTSHTATVSITVGSPLTTGTNVGLLGGYLTLVTGDSLFGARVGYSRP